MSLNITNMFIQIFICQNIPKETCFTKYESIHISIHEDKFLYYHILETGN